MYGNPTKQKEIVRVKPHVKKNDTVLILTGKDRGKQGKVLRVNATKGTAIVERANRSGPAFSARSPASCASGSS